LKQEDHKFEASLGIKKKKKIVSLQHLPPTGTEAKEIHWYHAHLLHSLGDLLAVCPLGSTPCIAMLGHICWAMQRPALNSIAEPSRMQAGRGIGGCNREKQE
jgi:hypothetical protein